MGGTTGTGGAAGGSGAVDGGGRSGTAGAAGADSGSGCERFGFLASGTSCASSGCSSFTCSCPGAFPKSIVKCSPDGCLIAADCAKICAEDLGAALACTGTYKIAPAKDAGGATDSGAPDTAVDVAKPMCSPTDVNRPPVSASVLGSAPLSGAQLLADDGGALYVAGTVSATSPVDFGGGALAAGRSLVLVKFDALHKHVWSRRFGSNFGIESVSAFSFAPNGDLLLTGITGTDTDLGGGAEPTASVPQIYVARYDRNGNFVRRYLSPATNSLPTVTGAIEAPSGDILVFGSFSVAWTIGATMLVPAGESDIFALRYASAGTLIDARRYGRARNDLVFDVVGAADGSVYLVGFSFYAIDFGQSPIELGTNSLSFVVRLDASLNPIWQKVVGGGGSYPRRAFLDSATLVVAGDTYGSISYGDYGDAGTSTLPKGNLFVFRIDSATGALVRGDAYESKGSGARITALGRFGSGGVAIGGYLQPPADFGGGLLTSSLKSYQPFVARYDGNGQHQWSTFFCTTTLAGGAAGAIGSIARDVDSPVVLLPFSNDLELGSQHLTGTFGTVLADMSPDP